MLAFGCFGGKSASDAAPSTILREDSAHQRHHSGASSAMRTSDKSSAGASSDGPGPARMALSEPTPWHEPGRGSTRSASIQGAGSRRRDADPALQRAAQHRSRRSVSQGEPHSPLARSLEDWHCLRRFAFVGDISSSPAAGTVTKLMLNRKTEELVSIKFLDRRRGAVDDATESEILNHRKLHSPHIVRFREAFVTDNYLAVVMENAPGGPLHRHILHKGRLPEDEARRYFRQLLTALAHCHGQGVYHRDLQLGALRFDACGSIVLTDFGYSSAKLASSGEAADVSDRAASPAYTPPEVLLGHSIVNANYDGETLDVWACGIILYVMVFGNFPFEETARGAPRSTRNIIKRLVRLQYRFPSSIAASETVKDLLSRVFVKSAAERIDFAAMAAHPWVTDDGALPPIATADTPQSTPRRLKSTSSDLLTGPHTPLGRLTTSTEFSQAEAAAAGDSVRRSSSGGSGLFGAWRGSRDKPQSDSDIAAVVKRALVRPS